MITPGAGREAIVDKSCDASLWGLFAFGLYTAADPRIVATFKTLREKLWVPTSVGGMARYENDNYYRVDPELPGNPWFISTLWLADHLIETAREENELAEAISILTWAADHALPSGILAEQVHPYSGQPLSVSPLTWSHATFIASVQHLIRRLARMKICEECGLPMTGRREDWLEKMFAEECDAIHGICSV
jgi:GH15 family glucan-1,4-alpha-glucosidase